MAKTEQGALQLPGQAGIPEIDRAPAFKGRKILQIEKINYMHIAKVHIENYKCFKGSFRFTLNEGINIFVGNNEAGKSSVIEAIHLVLTGLLNGKYLKHELNQYIFNNEVIKEYLSKLDSGADVPIAPHILIEIFIEGEDLAEFEVINNSERIKAQDRIATRKESVFN